MVRPGRIVERSERAVSQAQRTLRILEMDGPRGLVKRAIRMAHQRLDVDSLEFPLLNDDIVDSRRLNLPVPLEHVNRGRPLRVGFLSTPPAVGSGGHTTMFRMVEALEAAGHQCTLFVYDRYGGDIRQRQAVIRTNWPEVRARVVDATRGPIDGVDVCIATAWPTAHVLAKRSAETPMRRLYFTQDFEPMFYPSGSEYALAEDTYRFGFRCISIGHWVAERLRGRFGIEADIINFGCDHSVYRLENTGPRSGIVFYSRPGAARRGYTLGLLALREVHRHRPDVSVHVFGASDIAAPFPLTNHGVLTPAQIASLYNSVVAGLVLSFTNISLVPDELLACGAVPVLNRTSGNEIDLPSPQVRWAPPTPAGIAETLLEVLDAPPAAPDVAMTARVQGWSPAQDEFVRVVEAETYRT